MKKIQPSTFQTHIRNQLESDLVEINSTVGGRRYFLASLPLLLIGCSTSVKEKTRYREGDNTGQETELTIADEKRMSAEYAPEMEKEYPPTKDHYLQNYISNLGRSIASESGFEGRPYNYEFKVVNSKMVNAFALPAGKIYVTKPLINLSQSEAELAGVIGHEIAHVQARHTAERMEKAQQTQTKTILMGLGGALLGGAAGYGLAKALCRPKDRDCMKRITQYGVMAGGAGGLLISKFGFMAHSREDEMEADRLGYRIAVKSGFHKDYTGRFYWRLQEMERKHKGNKGRLASLSDALSTHPPSKERITQIQELMRETPLRGGTISSKSYKKAKKRV